LDKIQSSVFFAFLRPPSSSSLLLQAPFTLLLPSATLITFGFNSLNSFRFAAFRSFSFLDLPSLLSTVFERPGNPSPDVEPSALFHWLLYSSDSCLECSDCFLDCPILCPTFLCVTRTRPSAQTSPDFPPPHPSAAVHHPDAFVHRHNPWIVWKDFIHLNELGFDYKYFLQPIIQHLTYAIRFPGCLNEMPHYLGVAAIWRSSGFFSHFAFA
jgi:hypothetical protein